MRASFKPLWGGGGKPSYPKKVFVGGKKNSENVLKRKNMQKSFTHFVRVYARLKTSNLTKYFSFATKYIFNYRIIRFRPFSFEKHILLYMKKRTYIFVHMSVKAYGGGRAKG